MSGTRRLLLAALLALGIAAPARTDDLPAQSKVQALAETVQKAIRQAEPAIACILVSHTDAYRKRFDDAPPADAPGKLGAFPSRRIQTQFADRLPSAEDLKKLDLGDPDNVPESYGSGVAIDEQGLILTNYHVIRDATKIYVRLPGDKGSYADIHAADPRSDLAVLRLLDAKVLPVPAIPLGDGGSVEKGQWVLSLANPFAAGFRDGSPSASWGIVSNLRRRQPGTPREDERSKTLHHYGTLIQTDARLNLGVSGGALLNLKGELIGLTTALAAISGRETAGGFAVPLDAGMRRIVEVLRRGEEVEYGFLGVNLQRESRRSKGGVQISEATPGSPAQTAGLQALDVILAVNGVPVQENDDLFLALGTLLAGSEARLEVRSSPRGPSRTVTVTLAKFYVPGPVIASQKPPPVRGLRVDFTSVLLMRQNASGPVVRGPQVIQPGVYIREVQSESPAAAARLREGEVITHVNGQPVLTPAEFYRAVAKVRATDPLELTLASADWGKPSAKVTVN
jgi:S1-C subfamily serine protease